MSVESPQVKPINPNMWEGIVCIAAMVIAAFFVGAIVIHDQGVQTTLSKQLQDWESSAEVLRICRDGTRIYRYHDKMVVGWHGLPIDANNPKEVCD